MAEGTEQIRIRKMVDNDLARVNAIDRALMEDKRATTWPFSFEAYWSVYKPEYAYVAELNGKVVGFLAGYFQQVEGTHSILRRADMQVGPTAKEQTVGWIEIIGVAPEGQYKGIGRQLVEAFAKECESKNAMVNCLIRRDDKFLNEFYSNLGFKPWETVIYYKPTKE